MFELQTKQTKLQTKQDRNASDDAFDDSNASGDAFDTAIDDGNKLDD